MYVYYLCVYVRLYAYMMHACMQCVLHLLGDRLCQIGVLPADALELRNDRMTGVHLQLPPTPIIAWLVCPPHPGLLTGSSVRACIHTCLRACPCIDAFCC